MFDDQSRMTRLQLPATFRPRYPWFVWPVLGMMGLLALLPLWGAFWGLTHGWLSTDPDFLNGFIMMLVVGFALMAFPLLTLWSVFRDLPRLHVDHGMVQLTTIFGRVKTLQLSDYAEVSLGEAVLAKGYQPRLEAVPMTPGGALALLPLKPFVRNRSEAEALVALIRHAAGERPKPVAMQEASLHRQNRREWVTLAAISIGAFGLLVFLKMTE